MAELHFNVEHHFYTAGIKCAGNYSLERIKNELAVSTGNNTELIVHPGLETKALNNLYPDWHFNWEKEYKALLYPCFLEVIGANDFQLIGEDE